MALNETLEAARAHFTRTLSVLESIEVPEWNCRVYWSPPTMAEREAYIEVKNDAAFALEILIQRARDENGQKLFSAADRDELKRRVDSTVIERIVDAISAYDLRLRAQEATGPK